MPGSSVLRAHPVTGRAWTVLDGTDASLGRRDDVEEARAALVDARVGPGCEAARSRVLELLDRHGPALAVRTCVPGHLTGSALVVEEGSGRMLLLFHRKLQRWLQPGGHADGDTNLAHVALREATEETGIDGLRVVGPAVDLDLHVVDHGDQLAEHHHQDQRVRVLAPSGSLPVGNHESEALRWVDGPQLAELADEPGILRLAAAAGPALEELGVGPAGRVRGRPVGSADVTGGRAALHPVDLGKAVDGP